MKKLFMRSKIYRVEFVMRDRQRSRNSALIMLFHRSLACPAKWDQINRYMSTRNIRRLVRL